MEEKREREERVKIFHVDDSNFWIGRGKEFQYGDYIQRYYSLKEYWGNVITNKALRWDDKYCFRIDKGGTWIDYLSKETFLALAPFAEHIYPIQHPDYTEIKDKLSMQTTIALDSTQKLFDLISLSHNKRLQDIANNTSIIINLKSFQRVINTNSTWEPEIETKLTFSQRFVLDLLRKHSPNRLHVYTICDVLKMRYSDVMDCLRELSRNYLVGHKGIEYYAIFFNKE
jgi:hypothetical protein